MEAESPVPKPETRQIPADEGGVVMLERECVSCGYTLRGLALDGVCPECGTPIERSLYRTRLKHADVEYLRRLVRGALLVSVVPWAIVAGLVYIFLQIGLAAVWPGFAALIEQHYLIEDVLVVAVICCWAIGWWMLGGREPGPARPLFAEDCRRVARVTSVGVAALFIGGMLVPYRSAIWTGVGVALAIVAFVQHGAGMLYLRDLLRRVPDRPGERAAEWALVFAPIVVFQYFDSSFGRPIAGQSVVVRFVFATAALVLPLLLVAFFLKLPGTLRGVLRDAEAVVPDGR